jgi:DNA-binding NarL/FixJ family response regulator
MSDNVIHINPPNHRAWRGILTPRQAEVAEMVAHCHTNAQIAEALVIEEQTAKFHLSAIYERLGFAKSDLSQRVMLARWWWTNIERAELPLSVVPEVAA